MNTDFRIRKAPAKKKLVLLLTFTLMGVYVAIILYPLFNMFMSSFKSTRDIIRYPFQLPSSFSFKNYYTVFIEKGFYRYFINSVVVTAVSMFFVILFGSMGAYGVSRYQYRGNTLVYLLFLSGIMLPLKAALIPLYMIINSLKLSNSLLGIILIDLATGLPSTVFILSGFMRTFPIDLEYAARIDGCSDWRIYSQVVMPVCMPGIAIVTIYNAVPIWNDFFFPLVFIQTDKLRTMPVGLNSFIGQYKTDWSLMFTGLSISIIPMMILYLFMSKQFIRGMTAGAIK